MNRHYTLYSVIFMMIWLVACEQPSSPTELATDPGMVDARSYIVLNESLEQLKSDFNSNKGKTRLMFIVGDTCGICLRGMADLNDQFIARAQNDQRLITFVVHVPTLGAQEKHIPDAIPLLYGPRVFHYWDGAGKSGIHFGDTLKTDGVYAWDVWLAYSPDAEWLATIPPKPDFWMHQLPSLEKSLRLNEELFEEKTLALMKTIEAGDFARPNQNESALIADATTIPTVAQPRGVAIQAHLMGKGGFHNIKGIKTITQSGMLTWKTGTTTLKVTQDSLAGMKRSYGDINHPLASSVENILSESWQMHGPLFRWKHRGNEVQIDGMLKLRESLAWKLLVSQRNGLRQVLYIDSHTGDKVLEQYLNAQGEILISVRSGDFRAVKGFRFPFKTEYLNTAETIIASEIFTDIEIVNADPSDTQPDVSL